MSLGPLYNTNVSSGWVAFDEADTVARKGHATRVVRDHDHTSWDGYPAAYADAMMAMGCSPNTGA